MRGLFRTLIVIALACTVAGVSLHAQWLNYPMAGAPRTKDGKVPANPAATAEGKALLAEWQAANPMVQLVAADDWQRVQAMADSLLDAPMPAELLPFAGGEPWTLRDCLAHGMAVEQAIFWDGGCPCKAKLDAAGQVAGKALCLDLKTTSGDLTAAELARTMATYGYHRQAGFYLPLVTELLGRPVFDFFFVAVEKVQPFGVAVYRISDAAASLGQDETLDDLRRLKRCCDSNEWPNIEPTLREITVPTWYGKGGAA